MERVRRNLAIAIDVDGVLAEQVIPVLQIIKRKYYIDLSKKEITSWEFQIGDTNIKKEIELAEEDEDFISSMLPLKGAVEAVSKLVSKFYIVIATSRNPLTDLWTKNWLDANGIKYHRFVNTHINGKKLPEVQVLIDDYIDNILEFTSSGDDLRKAILFTQPWNAKHHQLIPLMSAKQVYVATDWDSVVNLIVQIEQSYH